MIFLDVLLQIVYFGRSLPYCIMDMIPYFRKWKIQPVRLSFSNAFPPDQLLTKHFLFATQNKIPTAKAQWDVVIKMLICHFTMELPLVRSLSPVCESRPVLNP